MDMPEVISKNKCKLVIAPAALFILVIFLLGIYELKLDFWLGTYLLYVFYLLILLLIAVVSLFLLEKNGITKLIDCICNNLFRLTQVFLISLFLTLVILLTVYTPILIVIEPQKLEEDIFLGNQSIKTITIKNMGADITNVTYNITGINEGWLILSTENAIELKSDLKNGEQVFIFARITIPQNETIGEYRGAIMIQAKANGKIITEPVPVILRVKPT